MTPKEAIELLHPNTTKEAIRRIEENGGDAVKAIEEACVIACEALEKQVPEKVEVIEGEDFHCPRCGDIKIYDDEYCTDCGQKLKWGEDDDE